MTNEEREEAIAYIQEWLKEEYSLTAKDRWALEAAISALSQPQITEGAYKQAMWERDTAIKQLNDLGYEFGEKIEPQEDLISRQAVLNKLLHLDEVYPDMDEFDDGQATAYGHCKQMIEAMPSSQPNIEAIRQEIADEVSDKMDYMHCCENERETYLNIILNKSEPFESHCERDCRNTECKLNPAYVSKIEAIRKSAPISDDENKLQGEWIYKQYGGYPEQGDYHCSECGLKYNYGKGKAKYCPMCGAKMVEAQAESEDNE